jgi:hypothetical protein
MLSLCFDRIPLDCVRLALAGVFSTIGFLGLFLEKGERGNEERAENAMWIGMEDSPPSKNEVKSKS